MIRTRLRIRFLSMAALLSGVLAGSAMADESKPTSGSFDAKGVKIHYMVQGHGEPVVLIHGLDSSAWINWFMPGTAARLAANHEVIALDLTGHGESAKPDDEAAYGRQMSEDVILLMDHLKVPKAHIVGYSLGGMIALRLISDHPGRVISGALGGMGWLREGSVLQRFWERIPGRAGGGRGTPVACLRSIGKLALTQEAVKAIKVPIIMLVGDHDPCRQMYVDPAAKVHPDWPVVEVADANHFSCIMKRQFQDELVKWVNTNSPPAAKR